MNDSLRHLVYAYLLHECLALPESHARQVAKEWYGMDDSNSLAADAYGHVWWQGVRAAPSEVRNLVVSSEMARRFELEGVAGFYFQNVWRLNIPESAALLKPYRGEHHLIRGLLVYRHLNDREPRLLTSRGLPRGTKAETYQC